jgi:hypothetical protein
MAAVMFSCSVVFWISLPSLVCDSCHCWDPTVDGDYGICIAQLPIKSETIFAETKEIRCHSSTGYHNLSLAFLFRGVEVRPEASL